jgi:glycosyltransferase involved in cell wall biosynthesis
MHRSARVLHITEAFCDQTDAWGISRDKVDVIPNWGALDMIDLGGRDNSWSRMQNLKPGTRFLYSGTLAMKHNPRLLIRLAEALEGDDEVILVSAGTGADTLSKLQSSRAVERMRLLPLQPFEVFADVLASGDVLLAVIEREAGMYSVPSKILSYLCAGRPIVLAAPADNLAAKIVSSCNAGHVVEPEDVEGFARAALEFRNNPVRAAEAGQAGRAYAEKNFHLGRVAERFEMLFQAAREAR